MYAIISAENPFGKKDSQSNNMLRTSLLRKDLKNLNLKYEENSGSYKNHKEISFKIYDISLQQATRLGKKFNQEAINFNGELIPIVYNQ